MKNISLKRIICFLIAMLMVLTTVGCSEKANKKKKKKVIVKKKIIVRNDEQTDGDNSIVDFDDEDYDDTDDNIDVGPGKKSLPIRDLPKIKEAKYVEKFEPEFDHDYVDFSFTADYVIVYSHSDLFNRPNAINLATYIKNNYNLNLTVLADNESAANTEKQILIGDTAFYSTSLAENEFAVKVSGSKLIFEGKNSTMTEKAVDWYQTVKIKLGKTAVLNGKQDDFKTSVNVEGRNLTYVWGDEFDGYMFTDDNKWRLTTHKERVDLVSVLDDPKFQNIENGRLRLTADRYYSESDPNVGYAMSGQTDTSQAFLFRNGYVEFRARLPYAQGAFPALWTMSSDAGGSILQRTPNYNTNDGYGVYKNRVWDVEIDLFESFSDTDHLTTTIHKWYKNIGKAQTITDDELAWAIKTEGQSKASLKERYPVYLDFKDGSGAIDIYNKLKRPEYNASASMYTIAYLAASDKNYNWTKYFDADDLATINNDYHIYSYLYTSNHIWFYFDGKCYLDLDLDPNYDYRDGEDVSRNNNGIGYNLWHYLIVDMMIYTPDGSDQPASKQVNSDVLPHSLYVDYVRVYQDLNDSSMGIVYPAGQD